jgi:hypothetical protein
VFSQNGIFWGSKTILVFNLSAPFLQKVLRSRLPELVVGVGEAKLTFNPPSIDRVLEAYKRIQ